MPAAIGSVLKMIAHPEDGFRKTGLWLMGETGDLRFIPVLARLMKESGPALRTHVFRTFAKLKQKRSRLAALPPLRLYVLEGKSPNEGWREIHISPLSASGQPILGLKPTQIALWEKNELILEYNMHPVIEKEPLSIGFTIPRNTGPPDMPSLNERAMESCLQLKRKIDGWMILQYCDRAQASTSSEEPSGDLRFILDNAAIERWYRARKARLSCAQSLLHAIGSSVAAMSRSRGRRHLVFLDDGSWEAPQDQQLQELVHLAKMAEITIHGISQRATAWRDICTNTGGQWLLGTADNSVPELLTALYAYLTARYQVRFPTDQMVDIGIEIYTEKGLGDSTLRVY
jgi:hypothetical protein